VRAAGILAWSGMAALGFCRSALKSSCGGGLFLTPAGAMSEGNPGPDARARAIRADLQLAGEIAKAFAHSGDADACVQYDHGAGVRRAPVAHLKPGGAAVGAEFHRGRFAAGVAVDVGQRFLKDAEEHEFDVVAEPFEIFRNLEVHFRCRCATRIPPRTSESRAPSRAPRAWADGGGEKSCEFR